MKEDFFTKYDGNVCVFLFQEQSLKTKFALVTFKDVGEDALPLLEFSQLSSLIHSKVTFIENLPKVPNN